MTKTKSDNLFERISSLVIGLLLIFSLLFTYLANNKQLQITSVQLNSTQNGQAKLVNQQIKIEFSSQLNSQSLNDYINFEPKLDFVTYLQGRQLIIKPELNLLSDQDYRLSIANGLQDKYGHQLSQTYFYDFHTVANKFTFLRKANEDKIIQADLNGEQVVLYKQKNISFFTRNSNYLAVIYDKSIKYSSIAIVNLLNGDVSNIDLDKYRITSASMAPDLNQLVYTAYLTKIDDGVVLADALPQVFLYDIDHKAQTNIELKDLIVSADEVRFAKDNRSITFRDSFSSEYYISDINSQTKSIPVGSFLQNGGLNKDVDALVLTNFAREKTFAAKTYLVLFDSNRDLKVLTSDNQDSVDPSFFQTQDSIVYSKKYQELEGSRGLFQINQVDFQKNSQPILKIPGSSLELPKLSADDRFLLVEVYKPQELTNYLAQRTMGFQTKPLKANLLVYDLLQKKVVLKDLPGFDGVWNY